MLEGLFTTENLVALITLAALEIVLGIDNIVFIAIVVAKLPEERRARIRQVGLWLAMGMRILLLLSISWVMGLTETLFTIPIPEVLVTSVGDETHDVAGRDLVLFVGGLFLIGKATYEVHDKLEGAEHGDGAGGAAAAAAVSSAKVLLQIALLDIVFSLDSVITAVGMAKDIRIMIAAVVIAVLVMMIFAGRVSAFVERHPTVKMLALSFLILIGVMLVVEGLHAHIPKGYIYFAMAFSLLVEMLNIRMRKKAAPVRLHQTYVEPPPPPPAAAQA